MDATTAGANTAGAELGCQTCLATFESREMKRAHMREEWHVYNLKRRIASLPPISEMAFQKQVHTSDDEDNEARDSSSFEQSCVACEQYYTNPKTWRAHVRSRNHIQKSAEATASSSSLEEGHPQPAEDEEPFSPLRCLFCNVESASLETNLTHMAHAHSFFIPGAEHLIDMASLLSYLFVIVAVFHECLFCGSVRSSKFAVQDHMRGKGHCKVDFEDDEHQLKQFYDFSGVVDDDGEEPADGVLLVPVEDELRLPSGKILGHRSRARYSRQHLSQRASSSLSPSSQQQLLSDAETETVATESTDRRVAMRAGTSTSLVGVPELQQRALMAVERKMMRIEAIARNAYQFKLEREGNRQKRYKVAGIGKKQGGLEKRNG